MQIEILKYIEDEKGFRKAFIDFKVSYPPSEKWEIFRNVSVLEKDNKKWLSIMATWRDEKPLASYERSASMKPILEEVLEAMKSMVPKNSVNYSEEENAFPF